VGVRRGLAVVAAVTVLTGCSAAREATAPTTEPTRPGGAERSVARDRPHHHHHVTPLPSGCAPGQLRLGPATSDGGGGELYQVWTIHLVTGAACSLRGTPGVRFFDAGGARLPFSVTRRWLGREHRAPVLVDARHAPAFAVAKYRCDTVRNPPVAAEVLVTLPRSPGTLRGTVPAAGARLGFCPGDDGDQRVHVGAIGSW